MKNSKEGAFSQLVSNHKTSTFVVIHFAVPLGGKRKGLLSDDSTTIYLSQIFFSIAYLTTFFFVKDQNRDGATPEIFFVLINIQVNKSHTFSYFVLLFLNSK